MADTDTDRIFGPMAVKILGWLGAAIGGALLVLLLNASGNSAMSENNQARLDKVEAQMHEIQTVYATNKRVDDLQAQIRSDLGDVRSSLNTVSGKVDNVLELLIKKK